MKKILVVLALLFSAFTQAAEPTKKPPELYMANAVGGFITIISAPCAIDEFKDRFEWKAILDNGQGATAEGCWSAPTGEPPQEGLKPIVTIIVKDPYDQQNYTQELWAHDFKTKKELNLGKHIGDI